MMTLNMPVKCYKLEFLFLCKLVPPLKSWWKIVEMWRKKFFLMLVWRQRGMEEWIFYNLPRIRLICSSIQMEHPVYDCKYCFFTFVIHRLCVLGAAFILPSFVEDWSRNFCPQQLVCCWQYITIHSTNLVKQQRNFRQCHAHFQC